MRQKRGNSRDHQTNQPGSGIVHYLPGHLERESERKKENT
jgi:hypothetical protein